jgi:hypothetical protein
MSIPPFHNSTKYANKLLYWVEGDSMERWEKKFNDANYQGFFKLNGWTHEHAIEYKFNSHGFRCKEFDNEASYIALGCSHTSGTGLPVEKTWPHLLFEMTNIPVLNLGVGGASLDTCFRLLDYYVNNLNILGVFVLEPEIYRFEMFIDETPTCFLPKHFEHSHPHLEIYKHWISSEENSAVALKKNRYCMQYICDMHNINLVSIEKSPTAYPDFARDLQHHGFESQKRFAETFYRLIK